MNKFILLSISLCVLVSMPSLAFAANPTSTSNPLVSYDVTSKQFNVSWNFDISDEYDCVVKNDVHYLTDMNDDVDHTKVPYFTPTYFSITSEPEIVNHHRSHWPTEKIPCTGSFSLDVDTLLDHFTNTEDDGDLEIYTGFYAVDKTKGKFTRIDSVWMFYTATVDIKNTVEDGDCERQVGNAIYIDPYGIHGQYKFEGVCSTFYSLDSNQYGDDSDLDGFVTIDDHTGTFDLAIQVIGETIDEPIKKSGCSGDCIKPTFGKDRNGQMIVEGGFSFNGNQTDVTQYWTPHEMITAHTNTTHNFTLKAYENFGVNNIKWFQFGIVPEVGTPLSESEVLATIYIKSSEVQEIIESDENNLFDIVNATSYIENCGYVSSDCLELSLDVIFRDELKNKVIVIQVMDNSRNTDTKFLNDGINTVGESINDPLEQQTSVSNSGAFYPQKAGIVLLTMVDYKNDMWQDTYGYMWSTNEYGPYLVDNIAVPIKDADPITQIMTRTHSEFDVIIQYEQNRAIMIFDASKIVSILGETFAYDLPQFEVYQKELAIKLEIEADKAAKMTKDYTLNQHLYYIDSYNNWNYLGDMPLD